MKGIGELLWHYEMAGFVFSVLRYQIPIFTAILSGAPRSPKRHLHQLILSTNKVTLELSSAVKYFGIDFSIFTLNVNIQQSDHIFPFGRKADFSLFSAGKKPLRYVDFRDERTFSVIAVFSRPKSGFIFLGNCKAIF